MRQKFFKILLIGSILINSISLNVKPFEIQNSEPAKSEAQLNQNVVSSRMTYGRFLEYLEMGWVKQVDLYDNNDLIFCEYSSRKKDMSILEKLPQNEVHAEKTFLTLTVRL